MYFGGLSSVNGFTLSATFAEGGKDWVRIQLLVERTDGRMSAKAHFYLHDSFDPPMYDVNAKNGRAKIELHA